MAHSKGVELRIRGLPDDTGRKLKAAAALKGIPFNTLVIEILGEAAGKLGPEIPKPRK